MDFRYTDKPLPQSKQKTPCSTPSRVFGLPPLPFSCPLSLFHFHVPRIGVLRPSWVIFAKPSLSAMAFVLWSATSCLFALLVLL